MLWSCSSSECGNYTGNVWFYVRLAKCYFDFLSEISNVIFECLPLHKYTICGWCWETLAMKCESGASATFAFICIMPGDFRSKDEDPDVISGQHDAPWPELMSTRQILLPSRYARWRHKCMGADSWSPWRRFCQYFVTDWLRRTIGRLWHFFFATQWFYLPRPSKIDRGQAYSPVVQSWLNLNWVGWVKRFFQYYKVYISSILTFCYYQSRFKIRMVQKD